MLQSLQSLSYRIAKEGGRQAAWGNSWVKRPSAIENSRHSRYTKLMSVVPHRISCRALLMSTFLLGVVFMNSGCIYFHNHQNSTLANEIKTEFGSFRQSSANPYSIMLQNHQKVELKAAKLQADMARRTALSFSAQVDAITWKKIQTQLEEEKTKREKRNMKLKKVIEDPFEGKGDSEAEVKNAKEGLNKARDLLKKAFKEQQKWEARQVLFRSAIKFLAKTTAKDKKLDIKTLNNLKKEVLDQEITIEDINAEGNLKAETSTVREVLKGDIKDFENINLDDLLNDYTYGIFNPESAPGLKVIILSLGMDLAKAQLDRAKLEVNYLKARFDDLLVARLEDSARIDAALTIIQKWTNNNNFVPTDKVRDTINKLRKQNNTETAIRNAFEAIAYYSMTWTLDESARMELGTRLQVLKHEYEIRLSEINAREHEVLISRGLQGLAIYHEGGVTPAMIANFLRAAQGAALVVIGVGVL